MITTTVIAFWEKLGPRGRNYACLRPAQIERPASRFPVFFIGFNFLKIVNGSSGKLEMFKTNLSFKRDATG